MTSVEGICVAIDPYCTEVGTDVQPSLEQKLGYFSGVPSTDPRTILWDNITRLAGVVGGSARDVLKNLRGRSNLTTLQGIKDDKRAPKTDTLLEIAEGLGVEVWELLSLPGNQQASVSTNVSLEDALRVVGRALSRMTDVERRKYALQTLAEYAADPADNDIALQHVLHILGGALPGAGKLKKTA